MGVGMHTSPGHRHIEAINASIIAVDGFDGTGDVVTTTVSRSHSAPCAIARATASGTSGCQGQALSASSLAMPSLASCRLPLPSGESLSNLIIVFEFVQAESRWVDFEGGPTCRGGASDSAAL